MSSRAKPRDLHQHAIRQRDTVCARTYFSLTLASSRWERGGQQDYFGSIFAAKVCTTILSFLMTNVSVPIGKLYFGDDALQTT